MQLPERQAAEGLLRNKILDRKPCIEILAAIFFYILCRIFANSAKKFCQSSGLSA